MQAKEEKWAAELASERERGRQLLNEKESRLAVLNTEVEQIRLQLLQQLQQSQFPDHQQNTRRSADRLPLESTTKSVNADVDRVPAGVTGVRESRPAALVAASSNVAVRHSGPGLYQGAPNAVVGGMNDLSASSTSTTSIVSAANVPERANLVHSHDLPAHRGSVKSDERSLAAGFQRSPSSSRKQQGVLEVATGADFTAVRQAKSADLSDISLSVVDSQNAAAIGGSCPSELSSGLLSIKKRSDSGDALSSASPLRQNNVPAASSNVQVFRNSYQLSLKGSCLTVLRMFHVALVRTYI